MIVVLALALCGVACSGTDEPPAIEPVVTTTTANAPTSTTMSTTTTVSTGVSEAEGLGDSFYPYLGNGGYDALHYEIDLDIDPVANTIQALTTITAQATQELSEFNLDLSGLTVEDVEVNGSAAEYSRYNTELVIVPANPLAAGAEFVTEVRYSGTPEPISDPGMQFFELGWHNIEAVVFTVSQPSGSMSWFPSNNHPTDKATFEIHLTVPAPSNSGFQRDPRRRDQRQRQHHHHLEDGRPDGHLSGSRPRR